jgi:hypothetical protein
MQRDGVIEVRPGDDDPGAIALMHKLSAKSRKRWPEFAIDAPRVWWNPTKGTISGTQGSMPPS